MGARLQGSCLGRAVFRASSIELVRRQVEGSSSYMCSAASRPNEPTRVAAGPEIVTSDQHMARIKTGARALFVAEAAGKETGGNQ
jgi:hypothetical protein